MAVDTTYTWVERKAQYNSHYFVEYGGYIKEDGTPNYTLDHIVERCKAINGLLSIDSILDCGCAHGWMVHGFRELNTSIKASGIDVSEFGISHSEPSIREKLLVVDITEGLPYADREVTLVTGFDVLEHLYPYKRLLNAVKEICRVAEHYILLRQPMTIWDGEHTEWFDWLGTLNELPHQARLSLVGAVPKLRHIYPAPGDKEHPSEHPRGFWTELFRHHGFREMMLPEQIYIFPNPNAFCSFNLLVFERE